MNRHKRDCHLAAVPLVLRHPSVHITYSTITALNDSSKSEMATFAVVAGQDGISTKTVGWGGVEWGWHGRSKAYESARLLPLSCWLSSRDRCR